MPSLSLCMIVKNEELFLADCLASVKELVDEMIIVDTGSSDRTVEIAERFGAKVIPFSWIGDFSAARNLSLDQSTCEWILVLDADERLEPNQGDTIRKLLQDDAVAGYSFLLRHLLGAKEEGKATISPMFKLFRNHPDIRFEGEVHEQAGLSAERAGHKLALANVFITHLGYLEEFGRTEDKLRRNLEILESQLEKEPNNPFTSFNMGECYKFLGRLQEAEPYYLTAIKKLSKADLHRPFSANLYYSLGELYYLQREFSKGLQLLDEAIRIYPDYVNLFYTKGLILLENGWLKEAIRSFEQCLALDKVVIPYPSDPALTGASSYRAIAGCYIKLGDRARAKEFLKKALAATTHPDSELYYNLGVLSFESQEISEALNYLVLALEKEPQHLDAWHLLGTLNFTLKRYRDAIDAWNQLLVLEPARPDLRPQLAEAYLHVGDQQAAYRVLEEELECFPKSPSGCLLWGVVQMLRENHSAAVGAWGRYPERPETGALLALEEILQGKDLSRPGDNPEALRRMALVLVEFAFAGQHMPLVQRFLDRLELLEKRAPGFLLGLGQAFYGRELYELAFNCLLLAQQKYPGDPLVYLALGRVCEATSNPQDAQVMYGQALELDPSNEQAQHQLQRLLSTH